MSFLNFPAPKPLDPRFTKGGISTNPPPQVAKVRAMLEMISASVGSLSNTIEAFGIQSTDYAERGGDLETTTLLDKLRKEMEEQEKTQRKETENLTQLLDDVLRGRMIEYLKEQTDKEIEALIDKQVKTEVAAQVDRHIPKELREKFDQQKKQLLQYGQELHNSESRHANSKLRENNSNTSLHTIYMNNGQVSSLYPENLASLFNLNNAACKRLVTEYEIGPASESKAENLNRFIQFCGVRYYMGR